jgi:hypothetical protein
MKFMKSYYIMFITGGLLDKEVAMVKAVTRSLAVKAYVKDTNKKPIGHYALNVNLVNHY